MDASRKQNLMTIGAAAGVIILSIVATVFLKDIIIGGGADGGNKGYQNVTFTDAVVACRDLTTETYGKKIRNLVTDSHSSRFDEKQYVYKIFLKMDLYNKKKKAKLHYINCFVRSSNGKVRKYEVYSNDESKKSMDADDTNMFGMPKRK